MKIILYNPPSNAQHKPVLPMSLLALAALLEGRHEYQIIDGNLEADPITALDNAIRASGTQLLGVTVMPGPQLSAAVPTCWRLKELHPELIIVWGGYFPSQHTHICLQAEYIDYVVRGHAELAFRELVDALAAGRDVSGIAGVCAKRQAESAERRADATPRNLPVLRSIPVGPRAALNRSIPAIPHPDDLPDYPYERIAIEHYIRPTFLGKRTIPHHSSYGCPFFCNFCAVVNLVGGRWVAQSAERVAQTTAHLVDRYHVDAIEFYDNNFFVQEARTVEFAERIHNLKIAWWGEARIDTLMKYSHQSWATMRDSGLKMIFLGAESGSDATLQRMDKGGTASTANTLAIAQRAREYGIIPEMSFVLGNPPDPEADVAQTIAFIRKLKRVNPATEIILYLYTPVPLAGELYDQAQASGFRFPETLEAWISPEWADFSQRRSTHLPWLIDPLRQQLHDFERVLNAYYPTTTDARLHGFWRSVLRGTAAWRYHTKFYHFPLELRILQRLLCYQRPETSGF